MNSNILFFLICSISFLGFHCEIIDKKTVLLTNNNSVDNSTFVFVNSSSFLNSIVFDKSNSSVLKSSSDSDICLNLCDFRISPEIQSLFVSEGKITLNSIQLVSNIDVTSVFTTLCESSFSDSVVVLKNSSFENLLISKSDKTFVSSGKCESQSVLGCSFKNITAFSQITDSNLEQQTRVESCILKDTKMENVENFFYGFIVSGLSSKTMHEFTSSNCTFNKCFRIACESKSKYKIPSRNNNSPLTSKKEFYSLDRSEHLINPMKERKNEEYEEIKGKEFKSPQELESFIKFINCSFEDCSIRSYNTTLPGFGGAIYMGTKKAALYCDSCEFEECVCNNTGGAICCLQSTSTIIIKCNFSECLALASKEQTSSAGALYVYSGDVCTVIADCEFEECESGGKMGKNEEGPSHGGCGGGVYIGWKTAPTGECEGTFDKGLIHNCTFEECYASNEGGGIAMNPNSNYSIRNCLIRQCMAGKYGGGMMLSMSYAYDQASEGSNKIFLFAIEFNKNKAGVMGHDIATEYSPNKTISSFFESSNTSTTDNNRCVLGRSNYNKGEITYDFKNYDDWLVQFPQPSVTTPVLPGESSHKSLGWIAAPIVVFVLLVIAIIIIVIICCRRRKSGFTKTIEEPLNDKISDDQDNLGDNLENNPVREPVEE